MKLNARSVGIVGGLIALIVAATGYFFFMSRTDAYEFKGGFYEPPNAAAPLDLIDQNGEPFSLADHKGQIVLVYFGYTYCPDFCPLTLNEISKVKDQLGDQASKIDVVMVTVDPARDSPEVLKQYLEFRDPSFIGLSGSDEQLELVKRDYGIQSQIEEATPGSSYYSVGHSTQLYAIDQDGNLRLVWPYGTSADDISSDLKHLLDS